MLFYYVCTGAVSGNLFLRLPLGATHGSGNISLHRETRGGIGGAVGVPSPIPEQVWLDSAVHLAWLGSRWSGLLGWGSKFMIPPLPLR